MKHFIHQNEINGFVPLVVQYRNYFRHKAILMEACRIQRLAHRKITAHIEYLEFCKSVGEKESR